MTEHSKVLLLNADYLPMSTYPLSTISWKDAITGVLSNKMNPVSFYEQFIHSPSIEIQLPSVVALNKYVNIRRKAVWSRTAILVRDHYQCQYCSSPLSSKDLTFDHVIPKSRGGHTNWSNIVACCSSCNIKKANRTPDEAGMTLIKQPYEPSAIELFTRSIRFSENSIHPTWLDHLYWEGELNKN